MSLSAKKIIVICITNGKDNKTSIHSTYSMDTKYFKETENSLLQEMLTFSSPCSPELSLANFKNILHSQLKLLL